jgi:hypothetical protein
MGKRKKKKNPPKIDKKNAWQILLNPAPKNSLPREISKGQWLILTLR